MSATLLDCSPTRTLVRAGWGAKRPLDVIVREDARGAAAAAARAIANLVHATPAAVLGLGVSCEAAHVYTELVRLHRAERIDFSRVTAFAVDNFIGLRTGHPLCRRVWLHERLFRHLNIDLGRTHAPDGRAADLPKECSDYEARIKAAGGIDLQLLTLGTDARIGFNEPPEPFQGRTRVTILSENAVCQHRALFGVNERMPSAAITGGIATWLEARRCVLLAIDATRAGAVHRVVEWPPTPRFPGSALQLHRRATLIADAAAARDLTN